MILKGIKPRLGGFESVVCKIMNVFFVFPKLQVKEVSLFDVSSKKGINVVDWNFSVQVIPVFDNIFS